MRNPSTIEFRLIEIERSRPPHYITLHYIFMLNNNLWHLIALEINDSLEIDLQFPFKQMKPIVFIIVTHKQIKNIEKKNKEKKSVRATDFSC